MSQNIRINSHVISDDSPTYFIADIASNHDGDLDRAIKLIHDAKNAGADAVKFQHFLADEIVSDQGFSELGKQLGHQAHWKSSVYDTFKNAECDRDWTDTLYSVAKEEDIDFLTTPYDYGAVNLFDNIIPAYKIGSGDITWLEFLEYIAQKGKPILLSTGASTMSDIDVAVETIEKYTNNIALLQCNTNYTGDDRNFNYLNLRVVQTYKKRYPDYPIGLSDHTPGHTAVLGAVALGARIIEKHFTDDRTRDGPDHPFSMDPNNWRTMVNETRKLEVALGTGEKIIEENEKDTVVLQRRCLRANKDLKKGHILTRDDISILRPAPIDAIFPNNLNNILGKEIKNDIQKNTYFKINMIK